MAAEVSGQVDSGTHIIKELADFDFRIVLKLLQK